MIEQHSIGYTGDGCLQVKRPNQQYQVLKAHIDYTINRKIQ